jgi:uncharacterized protein YndB with AHSA1/START domain
MSQVDEKNDEARSIVQTRVFDAPRELVFDVWLKPEHVAQWWGPNGFSVTTHEMDVRPGGVWRFLMHGPDGTDYPTKIIYSEVVRPERLVYTLGSDDDGPNRFDVRVTFEDLGAQTRLTMISVFPTVEARDFVVEKHGAIEGGKQTLARLAGYVAERKELASR